MADKPDFDKFAATMADRLYDTVDGVTELRHDGPTIIMTREWYIEQLRLTWNARGAADIAATEMTLSTSMGSTAAGPYVKNLDRELRKLDR